MAERKTMRQLLHEFNGMWIDHAMDSDKTTYEMIKDKMYEIERFHYDELRRVEDELTPVMRADLRRERGAW